MGFLPVILMGDNSCKGGKCARAECVRSCPGHETRVELSERFDGPSEGIDTSEFRDGVTGGGEELVIKVYVAAKVAEIEEVRLSES